MTSPPPPPGSPRDDPSVFPVPPPAPVSLVPVGEGGAVQHLSLEPGTTITRPAPPSRFAQLTGALVDVAGILVFAWWGAHGSASTFEAAGWILSILVGRRIARGERVVSGLQMVALTALGGRPTSSSSSSSSSRSSATKGPTP